VIELKISNILKIIERYGNISFYGCIWHTYAIDLVNKGALYTSLWDDPYRVKNIELYPLKINNEKAFNDCIHGFLKCIDNKLFMDIKIFDQHHYIGKKLRCTFTIQIKKVDSEIKKLVENEALFISKNKCESDDRESFEKRVYDMSRELLGNPVYIIENTPTKEDAYAYIKKLCDMYEEFKKSELYMKHIIELENKIKLTDKKL